MTLQELRAERARVTSELKGIATKAKADGRRLTADETTKVKELMAKDAELATAIETEEAAERESAELLAAAEAAAAKNAQGRGAKTGTSGGAPNHVREAHEEDPRHGFKAERDFFRAVMQAGRGGQVDNRLRPLLAPLAAAGSDEQMVSDDRYGGFLVPSGFVPTLLTIPSESDPSAGRTRAIPMASPSVKIPARVDKNHSSSVSGGLRVYRRHETQTPTSSRISIEQVSLEVATQMGLSYATEEVLADSAISFMALLEQSYRDEFGSALFNEKIRGTGVGEYLGLLNSPALVTVSKESGQTGAVFTYTNAIKMRARCWRYDQAIWVANHDCLPALSVVQVVSNTPAFIPSPSQDVPSIFLGRPIFFSEYCATCGTVGDVILANFSEYLEGEYQPLQSADSMHVRFEAHERAFKFWRRNAGGPWWKSALTPANSTSTLSPFVVLETR